MARKMVDPMAGHGAIDGMGIPPRGDMPRNAASAYDRDMQMYYDYQENKKIDVASLSKARRYKVIAVLVLILMFLSFGAYYLIYTQGVTGKQARCWAYEQQVEKLAQSYVTTNGLDSYPAYVEDIPGFSDIDPKCPSGGQYTWNPVTGEYTCSVHEHYPEGWGAPQSQTQSVVQTPENANNTTK